MKGRDVKRTSGKTKQSLSVVPPRGGWDKEKRWEGGRSIQTDRKKESSIESGKGLPQEYRKRRRDTNRKTKGACTGHHTKKSGQKTGRFAWKRKRKHKESGQISRDMKWLYGTREEK